MSSKKIILGHGSGGTLTHQLIKDVFLKKLHNPVLKELQDSAILSMGTRIAFTTDSFVVSPLDFPGGDIGKLAVCGTVNDLLMVGAQPRYLSLALIIEEGFSYEHLERIVDSIAKQAKEAGVFCVAGDLKVVEKGACDKIFINTSGIGSIIPGRELSVKNISPGDSIIITGEIGQHGFAVLSRRNELDLGFNIKSDCASLGGLLIPVLKVNPGIKFMRDPTRGGIATTLNEIAQNAGQSIRIEEKEIPVSSKVRAAAELLGIDPLYAASEGRALIVARSKEAARITALLKRHPLGKKSRIIGKVLEAPGGRVILKTLVGTERVVDMLTNEPLPRIC